MFVWTKIGVIYKMFDTIFSRKFKRILSNKGMYKNVKHQKTSHSFAVKITIHQ